MIIHIPQVVRYVDVKLQEVPPCSDLYHPAIFCLDEPAPCRFGMNIDTLKTQWPIYIVHL